MRKSGLVQGFQQKVQNIYFRASFFDQSSLYTTVNFLQFLAVLVTGYAICILLLYLTYLGINKWEMEPYTNYTMNSDDYYEEKIAEEQDELNDQLIEFSFKVFDLLLKFIRLHRCWWWMLETVFAGDKFETLLIFYIKEFHNMEK